MATATFNPISEITVLDSLLAVNLNISLWTARRKLTAEDLGGVELPPEDLASLGSKRICNPDALKIFTTLRGRAFNLLNKNGVRFLGGWAIPEQKADEVNSELRDIARQFEDAKNAFLADYDQNLQDWLAQHPAWAGIIANSLVSADHVRSRLKFGWQMFKVMPSQDAPDTVNVNDGLSSEVEGLAATLFDEIARDAKDIWKNVYAGRTEVTHKALSPIKCLRSKLRNLSFVHPNAAPIALLIESALAAIPPRGNITGSSLILLQGLVTMLSDPQAMLEHSQKYIEGKTTGDVLQGIVVRVASSAPVEAEVEAEPVAIPGEPEQVAVLQHGEKIIAMAPAPAIESYGLW